MSIASELAEELSVSPVVQRGQKSFWQRFINDKSAIAGVVMFLILLLAALLAPLIATHDPLAIPPGEARLPPSAEHWFGTDQLGRDVFARVIYAGRISLAVGIGAATLATVVGVVVGLVSGYRRGWVDWLLTGITDVFFVFPAVLLASALAISLGRGVDTMVIVLGLAGWPMIARVCRNAVLEAKEQEWVEVARATGCSTARILVHHIAPRIAGQVAVMTTLYVAIAILGEATLSFLAVGITEPTPSWGLMIAGGRSLLGPAPHIVVFPAIALFLTVVSMMLISDAVRTANSR